MKIQEVIDYCESLLDTYPMQVPADEITEVIHMLDDVVSDDRLVELPVKLGEGIYFVKDGEIIEDVVIMIDVSMGNYFRIIGRDYHYIFSFYNKTWFTDKKLAEKKLDELIAEKKLEELINVK